MFYHVMIFLLMVMLSLSCENVNKIQERTKNEKNKNETKEDDGGNTNGNDKDDAARISVEDDFVYVPQNVSGSYLTCGPDLDLSKESSVIYGCALDTPEGKKSDAVLDDWKISLKDVNNQDHEISDIVPAKPESIWHVNFPIPEDLFGAAFLVKAIFKVDGEEARMASETLIDKTGQCQPETAANYNDYGLGSVECPYLICNSAQLIDIGTKACGEENNACDKHFKLTADIDMKDLTFKAIAKSGEQPFAGSFDGDNFSIFNLSLTPDEDGSAAMFYLVSGALENIRLENVNVSLNKDGSAAILALVLSEGGSVDNCQISGQLSADKTATSTVLSGLIYMNQGLVSNSRVYLTITEGIYIDGLTFMNRGTITKSSAQILVNNSTSQEITIENVTTYGGTNGIAWINYGTILESFSTGLIDGGGVAAGVVGTNSGIIKNSYSNVNIFNVKKAGGFVGYCGIDSGAVIQNSFSTGKILISVTSGGFCGTGNPDTWENNYWDIDSSGKTNAIGGAVGDLPGKISGKHTAEMKLKETYAGWDFDSIWKITSGQYPKLHWQE